MSPVDSERQLTLLIPVRDEQANIIRITREITEEVLIPHVILVLYDDEDDPTLASREKVLSIAPETRFVRNRYGGGVINALRTGFDCAETEYVAPIMADMSDTPVTLNNMYSKIVEGYDLVVGSRYVEGGKKIGGPKIKYYLSFLANSLLYRISGIPTHDMTNAFVMYRKEVLDRIHIRSSGGFEVTMEIIAKCYILGYRIGEVPTVNRERPTGVSKFRLIRWIGKYMYWFFYITLFSIIRSINAHYERDSRNDS